MPIEKKKEFWVTNVRRDKDISIGDLRVTIRAGKSVNLLDDKHYHYTEEQLMKSLESGSIKLKSRWIKVNFFAPQHRVKPGLAVAKTMRFAPKPRSMVDVEYKQYDEIDGELGIDDEDDYKFAEEESDMVLEDNVPALAVDKVYKKPPKLEGEEE